MRGDELVRQPHILTNHAITIEAQPADVWPWLTQMGWHVGGYYTPAGVDRLLFRAELAESGPPRPRPAAHA